MGHMVIAAYRPKAGKEPELLQLLREHLPILRGQSLASERAPVVMRAADGTFLEIFEWVSSEAVDRAHTNPLVQKLWDRFGEVCDYVALSSLAESKEMFAHFEPIDL